MYRSLQPSLIVLRPRWTKLFAYADVLALRALNIVPDLLDRDTRSIRFVSGWLTSLSILLSRLRLVLLMISSMLGMLYLLLASVCSTPIILSILFSNDLISDWIFEEADCSSGALYVMWLRAVHLYTLISTSLLNPDLFRVLMNI